MDHGWREVGGIFLGWMALFSTLLCSLLAFSPFLGLGFRLGLLLAGGDGDGDEMSRPALRKLNA